LCPDAARFLNEQFDTFAAANPPVVQLAATLRNRAGVDILALIDHWTFPREAELLATLRRCGFRLEPSSGAIEETWEHLACRLPRIRTASDIDCPQMAIAVRAIVGRDTRRQSASCRMAS
jgi:hypothetical protein